MLHRVALVRTDVSEKLSASFIKVTIIVELGTTLAVTSNRPKLRRNIVTGSIVPSSPILVTLMKKVALNHLNIGFTSAAPELDTITANWTYNLLV
jgi:hypothetical protein